MDLHLLGSWSSHPTVQIHVDRSIQYDSMMQCSKQSNINVDNSHTSKQVWVCLKKETLKTQVEPKNICQLFSEHADKPSNLRCSHRLTMTKAIDKTQDTWKSHPEAICGPNGWILDGTHETFNGEQLQEHKPKQLTHGLLDCRRCFHEIQ